MQNHRVDASLANYASGNYVSHTQVEGSSESCVQIQSTRVACTWLFHKVPRGNVLSTCTSPMYEIRRTLAERHTLGVALITEDRCHHDSSSMNICAAAHRTPAPGHNDNTMSVQRKDIA